jgi:hypothetical protein
MFNNIWNEIKKQCFNNNLKRVQSVSVKPVSVKPVSVKPVLVQTKIIYKNNKLISSYEEDYTFNNAEIMKLWQRN